MAGVQSHVPDSCCSLSLLLCIEFYGKFLWSRLECRVLHWALNLAVNPLSWASRMQSERHVLLTSLFIGETWGWPSKESSYTPSNKDEKEKRLLWYKGGKLRAIHQWLYVLALKAHFLESLLMVVTSVTRWTLPALHHGWVWNTVSVCIHSAGAALYYLIAC